jgi:hypothetical protein
MKACKEKKVSWAIFSDNYGIWPYPVTHEWYDKNPNKVTDNEFKSLVEQFDKSLKSYEDIFFYHNRGRFHKLYKKLLTESKLKKRIQKFTHISEID